MADEFELWELIAAPIRAINEAEAASAARFAELLLDYALEPADHSKVGERPSGGAEPGHLRQVSFDVHRVNKEGRSESRRITIPLVQLLPLGGVSIQEATLRYGLSLRASPSRNTDLSAPRFTGRLAQTNRTRAGEDVPLSDANISIEIKLRQIDLPQGVLDVLQHTQGATEDRVEHGGRGEPTPPDPPRD